MWRSGIQTAQHAGLRQSHRASHNYHQRCVIVDGIPICSRKETRPQTTFNCDHSTHKTRQRITRRVTHFGPASHSVRIYTHTVGGSLGVCTRSYFAESGGVYSKRESRENGASGGPSEWSQVSLSHREHYQWRFIKRPQNVISVIIENLFH